MKVRKSITKKQCWRRPRAKTTPIMLWLRERTFQGVYGYEKIVDGQREARPSLTKEAFREKQNRVRFLSGYDQHKCLGGSRIANYKYQNHFDRKKTHYYFGHPTAPQTLVMLDIDIQKSLKKGTTQGAIAFANHLKRFWPDLYFESSTGGKGVHPYLVLQKAGRDPKFVNDFLKKLQAWLRDEAEIFGADIELVEVKGTCPTITMKDGKVESVKFGQFAKIPREASRFKELAATTVLDIDQLLPAHSGVVLKVVESKKKVVSGSISGKNISDDELAMIPAFEKCYEALSVELRDKRYVISPNDFAVFCVLQRFFHDNMNADGTLPVRRAGKFWKALYECGEAERPFNHHRFKVLRDFLSKHQHIDWQDHRYQWPEGDKKGISCKWKVTAHFYNLLTMVAKTGEASFVVIDEFSKGTGEWRTPVPYPIQAEKEREWWCWAYDRLEYYSMAA